MSTLEALAAVLLVMGSALVGVALWLGERARSTEPEGELTWRGKAVQ